MEEILGEFRAAQGDTRKVETWLEEDAFFKTMNMYEKDFFEEKMAG